MPSYCFEWSIGKRYHSLLKTFYVVDTLFSVMNKESRISDGNILKRKSHILYVFMCRKFVKPGLVLWALRFVHVILHLLIYHILLLCN
jgi:hypothetical protein